MNKTNLPTDGFCIKVDMNDPKFLECKKLLEENYNLIKVNWWYYNDCYVGYDKNHKCIVFGIVGWGKIFTPSEFLEIVSESGEEKVLTPEEMSIIALERERGNNIELWVDSETTEYWKEIYALGVSDERKRYYTNQPKK